LLAHWVYDAPQVERQIERDRSAQLAHNRGLLLIVIAWLLFWGVIFVVLGHLSGHGEDMPLFVAIMAGVGLVVGIAAYLAPHLHARRARRSTREAFIGRQGLFVNGVFYSWAGRLDRFDSVEIIEDEGDARLVFHLSALTGPGWVRWQPYIVEAPAPPEELAAARQVVKELRQQQGSARPD